MFYMQAFAKRLKRASNINIYKINISNKRIHNVSFEDIAEVSPSIIKRILSVNNVTYQEGHVCYNIACPNCTKEQAKLSTNLSLYINKTTGSFTCASCMSFGSWPNLESYLNVQASKKSKNGKTLVAVSEHNLITSYIKKIENNSSLLNTLPSSSISKILTDFNLPAISDAIFSNLQVRTDPKHIHLYFPLESANSQVTGYKVLQKGNENQIEHNNEPSQNITGILSCKSTKSKDTAIIVPNIADFLVLLNAKIPNYIVCLPNGLQNLPQQILPSLERYSKLILWFGNDLPSWDSARTFAKKLGEKRCLFVRPTEKQPLPHLAQEQDLKAIIAGARTIWHKSITTFTSLREDVLSELQNVEKVHGVKWKRFPTLSRILKGHRKGELTVITGPTGSGKTTFISEYSLDLAMQGVNTLWGSFEVRNVRLAKTMLQQFSGIPLDEHLQLFEKFADRFEKLPIFFMTFHGQQTVKVVMEAVEHAQYVYDIGHVIIDNVQFMLGTAEDQKHMDRFWKQDLIVAAFRTFATRKNCHVTLVIHPRKEKADEDLTTNSIFGGAKASQEADNIMIIQDKRLTSVKGRKYLQIFKNRYSGDLGIVPLDFDKSALSFAQKKKKIEDKEVKSKSSPASVSNAESVN